MKAAAAALFCAFWLALPPAQDAGGAQAAGAESHCIPGPHTPATCSAIRARRILDASAPAWSAVGRVNFAGIGHRQHCTGTLIAERAVLTAAHCLYDQRSGGWIAPGNIHFVAGYQRGSHTAAASVQRYVLPPAHDPAIPAFGGGPADDWALLVLQAPLDPPVRPAGLASGLEPGTGFLLAGYSGLRPHVLSAADCIRSDPPGSSIMILDCPAMAGDSGAPVLLDSPGGLRVAGIVSRVRASAGTVQALAVPARNIGSALQALR